MRILRHFALLSLLVALAFVARVASAQAGAESDSLSESAVDLSGAIVPLVPPIPPLVIAEGNEPVEAFYPVLPRSIDFRELLSPTQSIISDRLSILNTYELRVVSDPNPGGLPPRTEADVIRIPATARERFQPIRIVAKSDGNVAGTNQESDSLTITLGYYGPGTGKVVYSASILEPLPEGVTEPVLEFAIPPTRFDVVEPPLETGGIDGIISDYVDILTPIQVRFISSDEQGIYANLPPAHGFIFENIETGGGVVYALDFRSDVEIPEPASFILLSMGLLSLGLIGRRR